MALSGRLTAQVFENLSDERLSALWRQLQAQAVRRDPFSTEWWSRAGEGIAGAVTPCVTVVCDSERPLAIASFGLAPARGGKALVSYAGSHRDYFDVLAADVSEEVIARLCEALPWERITEVQLEGIPADSSLGPALHEACRTHGLRGVTYVNNGAPQLCLLDEQGRRYPDYHGIMQGKTSKQLQRRLARLGEVRYVRADRAEQIPPLMSSLFWLHQKRWHKTPSPSSFARAEERAAMIRAAQAAFEVGMLHLSVLFASDQPVAGAMGYVLGKSYYYHLVGMDLDFSEYSPARTFMSFLLNDLLQGTQVEAFDYLLGEEPYKLGHSTGNLELRRLHMTRGRARAVILKTGGAFERCLRNHPRALSLARRLKYQAKKIRYQAWCLLKRMLGYRYLGPGRILTKALGVVGRTFYGRRKMLIVAMRLTPEAPEMTGITVRRGGLEDLNRLAVIRHGFPDSRRLKVFFERTRDGMRYYIAFLGDEPVGSVWIKIGGTYSVAELSNALEVTSRAEGDGFVIDAWVAPAVRGKRMYSALIRGVGSELCRQNLCDRLIAALDPRNTPSVRAHKAAGFTSLESLEVWRLFGRVIRRRRTDAETGRTTAH